MSLFPAVSPRELLQSLQQILHQVTEQTSTDTEFGVKERLSIKDWIATAEATCKAARNSTPELVLVEQMTLALCYRTKQVSDKTASEPVDPLLGLLREKYPMLFSNPLLVEFSRKQVDYLSRHYPMFAKRLFDQLQKAPDQWTINFIKFCLQAPSQSCYRDKQATHWIDIFIKYPEIADPLMKCGIYEKLGLYPENIAIRAERGVCLKVELHDGLGDVPIREPLKQYRLKNRAQETQINSVTLSQIFHEFETSPSPNFAISMNGIINLNSLLLGCKTNKEGEVAFIDPKQWIEHKPCIKLTHTELDNLYGPIRGEPPYGFVLRADRQFPHLTQTQSQVFFDFVIRLDKGKYRVIPMSQDQGHGVYLRHQKMTFYPLSEKQGKKVIEMVAHDIQNYRISHGQGKSAAYIDIQPYLDEVFGNDFYMFLENMIDKLENKQQTPLECEKIKKQLALAKRTLDPEDFEKFMSPLIQKLVKAREIPDIHLLIEKSLTTLKFLLHKEADKISLPTQEEVRSAAADLYGKNGDTTIHQSLLALTRLCFVALHPYSIKVSEAERNTSVIGKIFQIAQSIPWKWLRDLLTDFLLLILGPFRGYRYQKLEETSKNRFNKLIQTVRNLQPGRYLNLPSQLFESTNETVMKKTVGDITTHLNILASRSTS